MISSNILNTKIVYAQVEPHRASDMFPLSRCVWLLKVPMMRQSFLEEFVGQDAGLWQSVHSFADLHVIVAIKDYFLKLLMFNYVIG